MDTLTFKTNIKCAGCIAATTPYLNEAVGEHHWKVDIDNPNKILSVDSDADAQTVIDALQKAGYQAEEVKS